jgi:hypothetical protein
MNTSFVRKLPAYRTKAHQDGMPKFTSQTETSLAYFKELLPRDPDTKLRQANSESRKLLNQTRFEMRSDKCISREVLYEKRT